MGLQHLVQPVPPAAVPELVAVTASGSMATRRGSDQATGTGLLPSMANVPVQPVEEEQ